MADWRRNGWEPAIYFQYLWDVFASPWYLFVSILLISAQPAENDDQTVSRLYRGHDVPGQGLASALHSGGGPSASKLQRREGPRLVSVPHVHTFTRAIRSGCNIVYPSIYLSVYPYIRISVYPYIHISISQNILKRLPIAYSSTATITHVPQSQSQGSPCPRHILRGRPSKRVSGKCRCKLNLFLIDHHVRIRPPQRQQRIHRLDGRKYTLWIDIGYVDNRLQ